LIYYISCKASNENPVLQPMHMWRSFFMLFVP